MYLYGGDCETGKKKEEKKGTAESTYTYLIM